MKAKRIQTSKNNVKPEFVKLECENCGAALEVVDKGHAFCRYCGQRYLVDESEGRLILDVNIKYSGDDEQTKKALKAVIVVLVVFLIIAVIIIKEIWEYNVPARQSELLEQEEESVREEDGDLLRIFCQDIFGKDYEDITQEEFASLRYIEYDYITDGAGFNELHYSFTDYKDCSSEEEFLKTVERWTCANANIPTDFTKFLGLTRVDTYNSVNLSMMKFSDEARITYVRMDEPLEKIRDSLNLADIEILNMGNFFDIGYLDAMNECVNLKEIYLDASLEYGNEPFDFQIFEQNKKLEKIWIDCGNEKFVNQEVLGSFSNLKVFYVENLQLEDCDFLSKLSKMEELYIEASTYPNVDFLKNMPNLRVLQFLKGGYVSAKYLRGLKMLEDLNVCIDSQEALEAIAQLSNLKTLNLYTDDNPADFGNGNQVNMSVLGQLENLETLYLSGSLYLGMEPVLKLPHLENIHVANFAVDLEKLESNESIKEISFFYSSVYDINTGESVEPENFLHFYPKVEVLSLDGCNLTNISFLSAFQDLKVCSLKYNYIQDFSPLYECKKLEKVSICGNPYEESDLQFSEEVVVAVYPWE